MIWNPSTHSTGPAWNTTAVTITPGTTSAPTPSRYTSPPTRLARVPMERFARKLHQLRDILKFHCCYDYAVDNLRWQGSLQSECVWMWLSLDLGTDSKYEEIRYSAVTYFRARNEVLFETGCRNSTNTRLCPGRITVAGMILPLEPIGVVRKLYEEWDGTFDKMVNWWSSTNLRQA